MRASPDPLRRRLLAASLSAFLLPRLARGDHGARFSAFPFSLGVASGSPRPDGVVIWTRLAPAPLEGGGMDPEPVDVRWEVAEDEQFRRIVRRGTAVASPALAHSIHVEVEGLEAGRAYHYRFMASDAVSAVGRTRTAPAAGRGDDRLRLAYASCQQYEQGYFTAHRHLAAEDPDLVIFLGDYIYESSWGRDHVRRHGVAEPATLEEYRNRYGLYKADADLQRSHAAAPWLVTWDDHEVDNDYAGDRSEELDPSFLKRRAVAYQAFLEHMPLRRSVLQAGGGLRLYDRHAWGSLAQVHVLDLRQYREHQACPKPGRGGGNVVTAACADRNDPARSMMGAAQERWLDEGLAASRARWNLIAQSTLFAPAGRANSKGETVYWTDGWDGYPGARERLLASIAQRKPSNPMILGGDVHATYCARIHARPGDPDSPVIATELCGTSISSQGPSPATAAAILRANPHFFYGDRGEVRGYTMLELTPGQAAWRQRGVETVKRPDAGISTIASAWFENGRPGEPHK